MYLATGSFIVGQFIFADVFFIELVDCNGDPIMDRITDAMRVADINNIVNGVIHTNFSNIIQNVTIAATFTWTLFTILVGAYIFDILLALCVPLPLVIILELAYIFLFLRAVIALVRGI